MMEVVMITVIVVIVVCNDRDDGWVAGQSQSEMRHINITYLFVYNVYILHIYIYAYNNTCVCICAFLVYNTFMFTCIYVCMKMYPIEIGSSVYRTCTYIYICEHMYMHPCECTNSN